MSKVMEVRQEDYAIRVLIVDDHPSTATTLARSIALIGGGISALPATSGQQALKYANENAIDILITDMMMPDMNGLELIEQMQSHPAGRPACTILMTAYDVPGLKETARRLNINEVLIKPVPPERVCKIVSKVMNDAGIKNTPQPAANAHKPFTILIADDYPDNISLLARYLKNEGYLFITAHDGVETLNQARAELPDLILLDVNMPGKDGLKVVEEMRADPAIAHIPVIILTAVRINPSDVQYGLNLGADDYVTKPFDRLELLARIRTKLRVKSYEDLIRRRNRELNILPEIGRELSARQDVHELAEIVLRRTVETLGAMAGHVFILNSNSPIHKEYQIAVANASQPALTVPPLNELIAQLKESRESIYLKDTNRDARWQKVLGDPTRSAIIVPMFGRHDLVGLLLLTHEQIEYFRDEHHVLLQAIASQAAIAVENARLYADISKEKQKFDAVLQGAADAIMMFDADGGLAMINPAAESLFTDYQVKAGVPLARGLGYDVLIGAIEEIFISGKSSSREIYWPDQRVFTALFTLLEGGGCVVLLHDVSHFKALERVKNEFIATASHDLRNPLTSIRGYSQLLLQTGGLSDVQTDFIRRIHNGAKNMAELVDNMLDLAKMDLREESRFEVLDLGPVLDEVADEFTPQAEAKGQALRLEKTSASLRVRGEALKLRQAFCNVVGNAVKYTPAEGTVSISLEVDEAQAVVKVQDTGYGIPQKDLPHIFERFYRVRNDAVNDIEGNGLGLAIVKSIIEKHGGSIHVESAPGRGACFQIALPLFACGESALLPTGE